MLHPDKPSSSENGKTGKSPINWIKAICLESRWLNKETIYTPVFSMHHALSDGWSAPILLGFVHETYLELINGETIDLKPDTAFEAAQIYLQAHAQDTQAYWTKALSQLENHTDLSGLLRLEA